MDYDILPKTLTGKVLLQGINALEQSDGKTQKSKYPADACGLEEFKTRSINYLKSVLVECENCDDVKNAPYPNVETWCAYLNISRVTLHNYLQRGGEWAEMIQQIKTVIVSVKSQLADHGRIPPMTWIFDAANNFSYVNTSEFHADQVTLIKEKRVLSADELPKLATTNALRMEQQAGGGDDEQ